LVVGGAGSGKTTLLRTLAMSLAHLYSPADAQMYALSFAGHELNLLEGLPHVGAVITGEQRERVLRLLRFLLKTLDDRRLSFAQMGVDNLEMYNHRLSQLRRANAPQNATYQEMDFYPAIIVLIDNVVEFQKSFPDEMDELMQLLRNGRAGGIHFAVTSSAPNISPQMTNLLEQRIALHLVERTDYNGIVGRLDGREPSSSPGSGILRQSPPLHVQIALPGQGNTDEERNEHMQRVIQAMSEAWGARARPAEIQVLPKNLALDTPQGLLRQMPVRTPSGPKAGFERILTPLGRESLTLKTKTLDWLQEGPHFLISGPVASGKSSLLRSLLLGAAYRYSPGELWMLLVDFSQRSLRPLAQLPHVTGYAASEDDLFEQLAHFQAELDRRRGQVERLRQTYDESQLDGDETYRFPPVVLAFDDYDQIPEAMERFPLMLDEIGRGIRRNTDLGYHLLLAGESSSLSRLVTRDILLRQVCLMRCGFSLMTADAVDLLGGRATAALRREDHPEGRGYWVLRGRPSLIQFAQSLELPDLIQGIKCQWQDEPRAAWPCPVPPEQIATMRAGAIVAPVVSTRETVSLGGMLDDFLSPELIEDYRNQKRSQ